MTAAPALSIVVPLHDELPNVAPLVAAVREALAAHPSWELLLVDDGSGDGTGAAAARAAAADPRVRALALARNYGQTAAMRAGIDQARAPVVVTLDGDLQNDPRDIPRLLATLDEGYDLVVGRRDGRQDTALRTVPSRVANWLIRRATGVPVRDTGCTLKAYRRALLDDLPLYSDMHRFIPALAAAAGARIAELPVRHHARQHGASKYGLGRLWRVVVDLGAVTAVQAFRRRRFAPFGPIALWLGAVAALLAILALRQPGSRHAFAELAATAAAGALAILALAPVAEGARAALGGPATRLTPLASRLATLFHRHTRDRPLRTLGVPAALVLAAGATTALLTYGAGARASGALAAALGLTVLGVATLGELLVYAHARAAPAYRFRERADADPLAPPAALAAPLRDAGA